MKYIVLKTGGAEMMIVFPEVLVHKEVAGAMSGLVKDAEVVGAGFVNPEGDCFGRSDSLGIKSRGKTDTELLSK